jgi:hypothetical protein
MFGLAFAMMCVMYVNALPTPTGEVAGAVVKADSQKTTTTLSKRQWGWGGYGSYGYGGGWGGYGGYSYPSYGYSSWSYPSYGYGWGW